MIEDSDGPGFWTADTLREHDAIDLLRGLIAGDYPRPPIGVALGFDLIEVEPGRAVFAGKPDRRHYNPIGSVHGGYIATLLDSAASVAVHSTLQAGRTYTTLELKVNFVRPLTDKSGLVRAEGKIISAGRRVATAEARLTDQGGQLCAHGTVTCLIFTLG